MFLIQLVEVTPTKILALLMVEMSSTLDQTNRGPRKTEVLLATAAYLRPLLEEEKKPNNPVNWMKLCNWVQIKASCRGIFTSALANLVPMGSLIERGFTSACSCSVFWCVEWGTCWQNTELWLPHALCKN